MNNRINPYEIGFKTIRPLFGLGGYLAKSPVEKQLFHLIALRVSQINGCAYCIDMHSKDLLAEGEDPRRLFVLDAWREAGLYSDRERAALAWAEAVNAVGPDAVPDAVYEEACRHFTEQELIDLTVGVIAVSSYNRLNIAFEMEAGSYQPGQHAALAN
jgi:AhpD family alkylhydroperoxidase